MAHYWESGLLVRERAWHGLGKVLETPPENMQEAMRLAGADWPVELRRMQVIGGGEVPDHRAVVRTKMDEHGVREDVLGIVGSRYEPVQNAEAFRWFDPFIADGSCAVESAGVLKGGRVVWVLAKIQGEEAKAGNRDGDIALAYLMLSLSHDGSLPVQVSFTATRVVCWNTISAALRKANRDGSTRRLRHTASVHDNLRSVRDTIDLARRDFSASAAVWAELMRAQVAPTRAEEVAQFQSYMRRTFNPKAAEIIARGEDLPELRNENELWSTYTQGPGADSAGRTAWGLYQAATHYQDHIGGRTADSRLSATWFGAGRETRQRAFDNAVAMLAR